MIHKWIIQNQQEGKAGRKEESCRVLKYNSSIPYGVWYISFTSSRPMVDSVVCVYVPSRLVAKAFGILDSVSLWKGSEYGTSFSPHGAEGVATCSVTFGVKRSRWGLCAWNLDSRTESTTPNFCPSWGSLGFVYVFSVETRAFSSFNFPLASPPPSAITAHPHDI